MLKKFYLASCAGLMLTYGYTGMNGVTFGSDKREFIPADARQAPGGYRSFHFWHSGFRGGK